MEWVIFRSFFPWRVRSYAIVTKHRDGRSYPAWEEFSEPFQTYEEALDVYQQRLRAYLEFTEALAPTPPRLEMARPPIRVLSAVAAPVVLGAAQPSSEAIQALRCRWAHQIPDGWKPRRYCTRCCEVLSEQEHLSVCRACYESRTLWVCACGFTTRHSQRRGFLGLGPVYAWYHEVSDVRGGEWAIRRCGPLVKTTEEEKRR
jgi:RNase P subunit RPR2